MGFWKKLFRIEPPDWLSITSINVLIQCHELDKALIEQAVGEALKLRDVLTSLCKELLWDSVYQGLIQKKNNGHMLTEEEDRYLKQAEINYLEMVNNKMQIAVLLLERDWNSLSLEDRNFFYRLPERNPGCCCSIITSLSALRYGKVIRIALGTRLTKEQAERIIRDLTTLG